MNGDPYVQEFYHAYCDSAPGYVVKFKILFLKYKQFVIARGAIPVSYRFFRQSFVELDPNLEISKQSTAYIIKNLKLKEASHLS